MSDYVGDPYAALGLEPGASLEEVRRAFRRIAKDTHPDIHGNDPEKLARFREATAAYEQIRRGGGRPPQRQGRPRQRGRRRWAADGPPLHTVSAPAGAGKTRVWAAHAAADL